MKRALFGCLVASMLFGLKPAPMAGQTPPKQAVVETSAGTFIIDLAPAPRPIRWPTS